MIPPPLASIRRYIVTALVLLAGFYGLHLTAKLVPQERLRVFVGEAYEKGALRNEDHVWPSLALAPGMSSNRYSDCRALLSLAAPSSAILSEMVAPLRLDGRGQHCRQLIRAVVEGVKGHLIPLKTRYWHGSMAVFATLLHVPLFTLLQISETIKAASYFAWMALALAAFAHSRRLFSMLAPVVVAGVFASGISFYSSFSYGFPYLFAVLALAGLVRLMTSRAPASVLRLCFFAAGMVSSFLFLLDGHLILLVPVSLVILYFGREETDLRGWALLASGCLGAFFAGFGLSHLVNQAGKVMVLGGEAVIPNFFNALTFRFSATLSTGEQISVPDMFDRIFNVGYRATGIVGNAFIEISAAVLLASVAVAGYLSYRAKSVGPAAGIIVVAVAIAAAFARVGAVPNHSFVHELFIGRYMFVPIGLALSAPVAAWQWRRRQAVAAGPGRRS